MELRRMSNDDIDQVQEMVTSHREASGTEITRDLKESISEMLSSAMGSEEGHVLVVSEGSIVLGFINFHLIPFPMIAGKECYISDLLVKEGERGKGVGTLLLDAQERIAKKFGCTRIMLNNLKDADSYRKGFYRKKGYIEREGAANFVKYPEEKN